MPRSTGEIVVFILAHSHIAAFWLQCDNKIAACDQSEFKSAVLDQRVRFRRPPYLCQIVLQLFGKVGERRVIILKGNAVLLGRQGLGQPAIAAGFSFDAICGQVRNNRLGAGQSIKPDRMGHVPICTGIGGQDQRGTFFGCRRLGQADPVFDFSRHRLDAVFMRTMPKTGILQLGVFLAGFLERRDARKQTAVHLWQNHMHRKVCWRQAALAFGPSLFARRCERHLKDRRVGCIQGRDAICAFAGKRSGVDDGRRLKRAKRLCNPSGRFGLFERGGKEANDLKAFRA